jgi:predicted phage tail protein
MRPLIFAKGSAPAPPPAPTRTPDNLRSQDTIEVVLGISEGPIKGLVTDGGIPAAASFRVGDTTLANSDGSFNFPNFSLTEYKAQGASADVIPLALGGNASSHSVGVNLATNTPVTRTTVQHSINYIDIRLAFSQLYKQNDQGIFNNDVQFKVEYKPTSSAQWTTFQALNTVTTTLTQQLPPSGGGFFEGLMAAFITIWNAQAPTITSEVVSDVFDLNGKTTSTYVKQLRVPVPVIDDTWDIRITKLSAASDGVANFTDMQWESYQEIVAQNLSFDNLACIRLYGTASDQFSSLPDFTGIYDGLIMDVPSNYDPIARTYTGVWDGTWKKDWTNNPALFLNELVNNRTWGMSAYFPIQIDPADVYAAAQWCDGQVPDGQGGTQPRYTFNMYITDPQSGQDFARYVAGTFNALFYDNLDGTARLIVDKDDAAVHLITPENTLADPGFQYSYTDSLQRFNDYSVAFTNPDLIYNTDYRRVFDQPDIDLNGSIPDNFVAVGCTNAHESIRRAKYKLISNLTEKEMVTFRMTRLGAYVREWDVALICDPLMGYSMTGRIKGLDDTRKIITLREPIYFEVGVTYPVRFWSPSEGIITRTISAESGSQFTFSVDEALPDDLPEFAEFSIEQEGSGFGVPKPYRVISNEAVDGVPDVYEINCIEINRNKWNDADNVTDTGVPQYSFVPNPLRIPSPDDVQFAPHYVKALKQLWLDVNPTFNPNTYRFYNGQFDVYSRAHGTTGWFKWPLLNGNTIVNHPEGDYDFAVTPHNYLGGVQDVDATTVWRYTVAYPVTPNPPVADFTVAQSPAGLEWNWTATTAPDNEGYEIRRGSNWASAELVVTDLQSTHYVQSKTAAASYTFLIADFFTVNGTRVYSNATSVTITLPFPSAVKDFVVTSNLNMLNGNWTPNPETNINHYTIREGDDWSASTVVIEQLYVTHFQVPSNYKKTRTFWIKAVDNSGNESQQAAAYIFQTVPTDDYNIIVTSDEQTGGYAGTKIDTEVDAGTLILSTGKQRGEYIHPISLGGTVYARNVLTFDFDAVVRSGLTWDDMTFPWTDPRAHRPWVLGGDIGSVVVKRQVSFEKALAPPVIEGFDLNGALTGLNGTTASSSTGAAYEAGRFRQGLSITPGTSTIAYTMTIPSSFNLSVWVRPRDPAVDLTILTLHGSSGDLILKYDGTAKQFYLIDPSSNRVTSPTVVFEAGDPVLIAIVQTSTTRRILVGITKEEAVVSNSGAFTPVGAFTDLRFY